MSGNFTKALAAVLLALIWVAGPTPSRAQDQPAFASWKDRIFTGGSLGLQLGNWFTLVDVSPVAGYYITPRFAVGTGFTYKYYKQKDLYYITLINGEVRTYDHVANIYGGSLFFRYYFSSESIQFFNNLFAHTEYEYLNYNYHDYSLNENYSEVVKTKRTRDISSYFVGAGLRQFVSQNSFLYLLVLWNLNETIYSPYDNPIIRVGINVGF